MGIFGNFALLLSVALWSSALSEILTPEATESLKNIPRPALKEITVLETGLNNLIYTNVLVSTIYNFLGGVECTGIDGNLGAPLASTYFGLTTGEYVDFSGKSLCKNSCAGTCVPYPDKSPAVAPASLYPFGCDCTSRGCNANGPIPPPHFIPGTMISCDKSTDCTCANLKNPANTYTGYICNWFNLANGDYIYIKYNATYSPIRWCNCCPRGGG